MRRAPLLVLVLVACNVGSIQAQDDKARAAALAKRYVDGPTVPHVVIAERFRL